MGYILLRRELAAKLTYEQDRNREPADGDADHSSARY